MPWRNDATPRNTQKPNATKSANLDGKAGVLHGAHMGGHSDVSNPLTMLTKPIKAVSDAVGRYMDNTSEANRQASLAEKNYGRGSAQYKKAQSNYQGAVFQNRKPPKAK